jgi:hypothetical protein
MKKKNFHEKIYRYIFVPVTFSCFLWFQKQLLIVPSFINVTEQGFLRYLVIYENLTDSRAESELRDPEKCIADPQHRPVQIFVKHLIIALLQNQVHQTCTIPLRIETISSNYEDVVLDKQ